MEILMLILAATLLIYGGQQAGKAIKTMKQTNPYEGKSWYQYLLVRADFYRIPRTVALSQVHQESRGNEKAVGSAGEIGLFQLKPAVAIDYATVNGHTLDIHITNDNIEIGLWYLSWLKGKWGLSISDALTAYNTGIGNFLNGRIQNATYASDIIKRSEGWV